MGEISVDDDELGFQLGMANGPTKAEKEKRKKNVEEWRIARCCDVLSSMGPRAWSTTRISETGNEFVARRFTSLPRRTAYRPPHARTRLPASRGVH